MKARGLLVERILGGYFYDDQAAVRAGARRDGESFAGDPVTPGFDSVRMPASGVGLGLELEDGSVAWGDAISVQYPGVADRDPPLGDGLLPLLTERLAPALDGLETARFREADDAVVEILGQVGLKHQAIAFGASQALLAAAARSRGCTMAEVVCDEFALPLVRRPVPIFAQSGDRSRDNVDKMILKRVDALPHGLVNNVAKFGPDGGVFLEYVDWVVARIGLLASSADYAPALQFDLYGVAGQVFGDDDRRVCAYLARVAQAAAPYTVRIETPVIAGSRSAQIERLAGIREQLQEDGVPIVLIADEWCNTLADIREFIAARACDMVQIKMPDLGSVANSVLAVAECRETGVGSYLGGSCAETDISARVAVHIAVATQADVQLAKPGMGVDEGLMIVANEQARLLAELAARSSA